MKDPPNRKRLSVCTTSVRGGIGGSAGHISCHAIRSGAWERLHDDPIATCQTWYCKDCEKKYQLVQCLNVRLDLEDEEEEEEEHDTVGTVQGSADGEAIKGMERKHKNALH